MRVDLSLLARGGLCLLAACAPARAAAPWLAQRDGVLGTSFQMQVAGAGRQTQAAVDAALAEVARQQALLSTWDPATPLSAYNAGTRAASALPQDITRVLALCEQWRQRSAGAFSCRLGGLAGQWRQAEGEGRLPDRIALRRQARALAGMDVPGDGPLDPAAGLRFDVDGLAKGYIIDRALDKARAAAPRATGIAIDIGGDAVYWGHPDDATAWTVGVADPKRPLDNGTPLARVHLETLSIAASGHTSRGYRFGNRHLSHILDPQQGWPVAYAPGATVVARDTVTADALATALTVLPISEGLALVERTDGAAALIVSDSGIPFASARWPALLAAGPDAATPPSAQAPLLLVDYAIPPAPAGAGPEPTRPYLAIWIERADGSAVRQLLVLGDRARWLAELPRWWRQYGRNDPAGALGLARPTRAAGQYALGWDGRDDLGNLVQPGAYVLHVEAARQHGGHEQLQLPFVTGQRGVLSVQGRQEIGRIRLHPPDA